MISNIEKVFAESIKVKEACIKELDALEMMAKEICASLVSGKKIMLCGNGGSAADAQHLAAEMLIRLRSSNNREAVPAIALAQDTSTITACGNDFGYEQLYMRMVSALGNEEDCLIGITTSGNSENIIKAMKLARHKKIKVFGFLGAGGGAALKYCDIAFVVPSSVTGRVQEAHITAGHALMESIEDGLLEVGYLNIGMGAN